MAEEVLTWVKAATGRQRLIEAVRSSAFVYQRPAGNGASYDSPLRGSLIRTAELIPQQGLLKISHLLAFVQTCQRLRVIEIDFAQTPLIVERGDRQMNPSTMRLNNPEAFVKPETLQRVIDRFYQAEFY